MAFALPLPTGALTRQNVGSAPSPLAYEQPHKQDGHNDDSDLVDGIHGVASSLLPPIINTPKDKFESLVVEMPSARSAVSKKPIAVVEDQD